MGGGRGRKRDLRVGRSVAFANMAQKRTESGNGAQRRCIHTFLEEHSGVQSGVGGSNTPRILLTAKWGTWKWGGALTPAQPSREALLAGCDEPCHGQHGGARKPDSRSQRHSCSQIAPVSGEMSPCCRCGTAHADGAHQGPPSQPAVHSTGVPWAAPLHWDQGRGRVKPPAAFTHTAARDGRVAEGLRPQLRPCEPGLRRWGTGGTRRACACMAQSWALKQGKIEINFIFF